MDRSLADFVEDMATNGRTLLQIRAVAGSTRWAGHEKEIEEEFRRLQKTFRKLKDK